MEEDKASYDHVGHASDGAGGAGGGSDADGRTLANDSPTIHKGAHDVDVLEGAEVEEFDRHAERRLLWKVDMHLIPWLSLLYLLSFLDRSAIGNAALYGLAKDIHATDQQYRWGLTVFFFPYALFEPASNVVLKKLRPSIWLPVIMIAWAICMTMQGVITSPGGLYATRFCLGLAEAGLFPGVQYFLSCWYKRSEFGVRAAIFFSAATIAGSFGGLLAVAIHNMDGVGGYAGWRWIFIIEGLVTFVIGVLSFFFCYDFPDTARFLTASERAFVVRRLQSDDQFSAGGEGFQWKAIRAGLRDPKMWIAAFVYVGSDAPLYAFSLFTPTIVQGLGFKSPSSANLISVPIYVWACLLTIGVGFAADRTGGRGYYNLVFMAIGAAGYIILIASRNYALSYFATYLAASGIYPLIANTIAWTANITEGSYKRAFVMGVVIGWGNVNGAVSSNIYRAVDKPWYRLGHGLVLMYIGIGFVSTVILLVLLKRENRRRDQGLCDEAIGGDEGEARQAGKLWFATVEDAKRERGDLWSGFRYRL